MCCFFTELASCWFHLEIAFSHVFVSASTSSTFSPVTSQSRLTFHNSCLDADTQHSDDNCEDTKANFCSLLLSTNSTGYKFSVLLVKFPSGSYRRSFVFCIQRYIAVPDNSFLQFAVFWKGPTTLLCLPSHAFDFRSLLFWSDNKFSCFVLVCRGTWISSIKLRKKNWIQIDWVPILRFFLL